MARRKIVGLDIGTTAVRAAAVTYSAAGPSSKGTLTHFAQVPLPSTAVRDGEVVEPEIVTSAIKQLWSRGKFSTRDVAVGVGNQRVIVRDLTMPWMPLAQLRSSLPYQVQEILPMSVDDAVLDFYPTGEGTDSSGRNVSGLFVGAVRETVTANLLAVTGAGLNPVHVDLNGFALLRSTYYGAFLNQTVAVVDVGARITNVVIHQQGAPKLVRVLASGGQEVTDAVASAMRISTQEAEILKREVGVGYSVPPERQPAAEATVTVTRNIIEAIRNTFVYFAQTHNGAAIDTVLLTGGGSHLPGFWQYLSSASRINVGMANPLENLNVSKSAASNVPAGLESTMALAIGLGSAEVS